MVNFDSKGDKIFNFFNSLFMILILVAVLYPLYFILIASVSDPLLIQTGKILLIPKGITFDGYLKVFADERVFSGYLNSLLYAVLGASVTLITTLLVAYPLSRRDFKGGGFIMLLFTITMFFDGGMIPHYLNLLNLNLLDTIWAIIFPCTTAYYILITRTYMQTSVPEALYEAASIDGCSHFKYFCKVLLPLCTPIIAVLVLFAGVAQWNNYMKPLLYLTSDSKMPLQVILRSILIQNTSTADATDDIVASLRLAEQVKYALIIVANGPILLVYPFIQKYLVKGIMVGSIKG